MTKTAVSEYELRSAHAHELAHAFAIDDAALAAYAAAGMPIVIADDHPFVLAEQASWRRALESGGVCFATYAGEPVGFYVLGRLDDRAYLEQLAVRPEHGRRGLGSRLLEHACEVAQRRGEREIWLNTYEHMPWNRPFYERHGFGVVPEARWGAGMRDLLAEQRRVLPEPRLRCVMVRLL